MYGKLKDYLHVAFFPFIYHVVLLDFWIIQDEMEV